MMDHNASDFLSFQFTFWKCWSVIEQGGMDTVRDVLEADR